MICTNWRGIDERITWMLDHPPGEVGQCARETWHALGGDQSTPCPPAWGTPDANAVYDEIIASGRYWTTTPIPRGAVIAWRYGDHGHAALSAGDGWICTTDPEGNAGGTGIEPLNYPERWGASPSKRIWTDQYNGVRFDVAETVAPGTVYLSKLHYGQEDSDSVSRLQLALNGHSLQPPGDQILPITGTYADRTDEVVRADQAQHGYGNDPAHGSSVGPKQAEHLFAGTGNTIINDLPDAETPGEPEQPETITLPRGITYHYSGKPAGTFTFSGYKKLDVASWAPPKDGYLLGMIYANVDGSGEFKSRLIREDPDDETAYQTHYPKSGDHYLLTHVWFEKCEANRKLHYELGTADGETMTAGTRYVKFLFVPEDLLIDLGSVAGGYAAARTMVTVARPWLPLIAALIVLRRVSR